MKIMLALMAGLIIISPVWAEDEPIVLAMKTFEVGPVQGSMRIAPQVGGEPGTALTAHVLAEDDKVITAEDGKQLTQD